VESGAKGTVELQAKRPVESGAKGTVELQAKRPVESGAKGTVELQAKRAVQPAGPGGGKVSPPAGLAAAHRTAQAAGLAAVEAAGGVIE